MRRGDTYPPWLKARESALAGLFIVCASVLLALYYDSQNPDVLLPKLYDIARDFSEIGLMALGMTLVILCGGIDLSIGSIMGLSAAVLGLAWNAHLSKPVVAFLAVLSGSLAGGANGWFVSRLKLPSFLVTLATLMIYRGLTHTIAPSGSLIPFPVEFLQGNLLEIPVPIYIFALLAVSAGMLLGGSYIGRYLYATGSNETATYLAGIDVPRLKLGLYTLNGFLAGLSAILYTARPKESIPTMDSSLEIAVIAAVVLGGTGIGGGRGHIPGTVLGLLLVTLLRNIPFLSPEGRAALLGLILLSAAALDRHARRKSGEEAETFM
ncbi:MAG: ABC transporter permease [Armatimonadetes bacterium]|nr:ABC transporter permease [Armatimonadota bacterium]